MTDEGLILAKEFIRLSQETTYDHKKKVFVIVNQSSFSKAL